MKLREVIKHEGNKWVLYASNGKKKLGTFDTEGEAKKREKQIQFFKHQGEARKPVAALVEKLTHTAAWHRCWEKVKGNYDDRAAAAICTWSIQRPPNPPEVYKGTRAKGSAVPANSLHPLTEAMIALSLDDAYALDEVLAAEMELRGISEIRIDTDTWAISEITSAGAAQNPTESMPEYSPEFEAVQATLAKVGLLEVGARHTRREYQTIEEVVKLLAELHGQIDSLDALLKTTQEAAGANVAGYLEANIHSNFTGQADTMLAEGVIERDERIALSHAIGLALDAFAAEVDAKLPGLRMRPLDLKYVQFERESASTRESDQHLLLETLPRSLTEATIDEAGNLKGVVVVEGQSANRNVYTYQSLESARIVFAGQPVFADHPTRTEEVDRPERSVRDLVGRLPTDPKDFFIEALPNGRNVLRFRSGKLSETAGWLSTLIREGIAGDMSINASGRGNYDGKGNFVVEAFTSATSLDFVTRAAAGGRGELQEAAGQPTNTPNAEVDLLSTLTVAKLAEARPDIVNDIAQRERQKAYGEKQELIKLKEAHSMTQQQLTAAQAKMQALKEQLAQTERGKRKIQADQLVAGALTESGLPGQAHARVKRLIEADVQKFVEADVPTIKLPKDVDALPDDAKAIWMGAYFGALPTEGEEPAMHKAWAALTDAGWKKGDSGTWAAPEPGSSEQPGAGVTPVLASASQARLPDGGQVTEATLKQSVEAAIKTEREYLASLSGAGAVTGLGADGSDAPQNVEEQKKQRVAAYQNMGLTEAEAKIAVEGRKQW